MELLRRFSFTLLLMTLTTLVACGGSGDGGLSRDGTVDDGGEGSTVTLVLSIDNENVSNANSAEVTATLKDDGTSLSGKVITFSTTLGILDPLSGTALTDENGQATIEVHAGTIEGAGQITASYGEVSSADVGFTSAGDGTEEGGNSLTITSFTNSISVSNAAPASVTIHFEQADGTDLTNEVITFTSTLGALDPVTGTVLTNGTGNAIITLSAGTVRGAGVLTATSGAGDVVTQGFFTEGDGPIQEKTISLTISSPNVSDATNATLTATLLDKGVAVEGTLVEFSLNGTLSGLLVSEFAFTDANGEASVLLSSDDQAGIGLVTVSVVNGADSGSDDYYGYATASFTAAGDGAIQEKIIKLTISNPNVSAATPTALTATVLDKGIPVSGRIVQFSTTIGYFDPSAGPVYQYVFTDVNGQATITLKADNIAGNGVVTASVSDECCYGIAQVGFISAGDGAIQEKTITLIIDNPSVSDATPRTLTATVLNSGVPVVGEVVSFTSILGELSPSLGAVVTDSSGQASITLQAGTVGGTGIVTATHIAAGNSTVNFLTLGDGINGIKQVELIISPQSIDNSTPSTITAKITDSAGNILRNELVTFVATIGVLDPSSGTSLSDVNGEATITLKAGTIKGAGIVTATLETEESNTITFITEGDGFISNGKTVSIELVDTVGLGTTVSAVQPRQLKATVTEDGVVVPGEVVTFESTLGAFSPVSGKVLTDVNGEAVIQLTAGSIEGAGLAKAGISSGDESSVGFFTAGDVVTGVTISLDLTDVNGNSLAPRQINRTNPGKISATVTGITEAVLVTFSNDLGSIPISTAITDVNNVAVVDIFASESLGAGTISATLNTGETAQMVFSIGASSLGMGSIAADNEIVPSESSISAGGTTSIPITIWDTSVVPAIPFTDPVEVNFSSICGSSNKSVIDSPITTINGVATANYRAQGCEITDTVTATANAGGIVLSATGTVTVAPSTVGSLLFVSATPESIFIKGTGAAESKESSTLLFRLIDSNGEPMENEEVCFNINTDVGGLRVTPTPPLGTSCVGFDAANTTDSSGNVLVTINSGTAATTVRLTASASVNGNAVTSQSSNLVISTGIPDQDSFSLSADILNPEAWDVDGEVVKVTARLADAFNNPAPDGTVVLFTTEGGSITPSCKTAAGECTVDWVSQNPRPEGKKLTLEGFDPSTTNIMGQTYGGRVTILATALGNESFPDLNGNGLFDADEETAFAGNNVSGNPYDLPEAFVDYNEDGIYKGGASSGELETYVDFDQDDNYDTADTEYNGILCGSASNCSSETSTHIRGELVLVMSGSSPQFVTTLPIGGADIDITSEGTANASVIIADLHNQPMPEGTDIIFSVAGAGSVDSTPDFVWPNENRNGGREYSVTIKGEKEDLPKTGTLWVTVKTDRLETSYPVANILIHN